MLLVQKTINGTVNKISNETWNLESPYKKKISSITPINRGIRKAYGGYSKLDFGEYSCIPSLFDDDWPPPLSCAETWSVSSTTEAAATALFTGTTHLKLMDRENVIYELYDSDNSYVLPDGQAFADTLENVFTWMVNAARMNLTLDATLARDPSPAVSYTTSGEQLGTEFLDGLAAFYSHFYYISGSTLYLVDMASNNGTRTLSENDYFSPDEYPVEYFWNVPCAVAKAGDFSQSSSYTYGETISETAYHSTQANVETALDDIITYQNKARARLSIPTTQNPPSPGEQITFTDTSHTQDITMVINARVIQYDFDNDAYIVEGEGTISA